MSGEQSVVLTERLADGTVRVTLELPPAEAAALALEFERAADARAEVERLRAALRAAQRTLAVIHQQAVAEWAHAVTDHDQRAPWLDSLAERARSGAFDADAARG